MATKVKERFLYMRLIDGQISVKGSGPKGRAILDLRGSPDINVASIIETEKPMPKKLYEIGRDSRGNPRTPAKWVRLGEEVLSDPSVSARVRKVEILDV